MLSPSLRNRVALPLLILSNTVGNLLLANGVRSVPDFEAVPWAHALLSFVANPWILAGVALLAVWMFAQLSVLTWADLSYVLPMTAFGYVLSAVLAMFFLGESISTMRWAGIGVIAAGVFLVAETPERTRPLPKGPRS